MKKYLIISPNSSLALNILAKAADAKQVKLIKRAIRAGKNLKYDEDNQKIVGTTSDLVNTNQIQIEVPATPEPEKVADPAQLAFINTLSEATGSQPEVLKMTPTNWKYLCRSVLRGKNIMMTGPAGCGKTFAAQQVSSALSRELSYFNLGATQDPRSTLIGNMHFDKETGTVFAESEFVRAIQKENSVILLDELSRANPEAWNILMTVLDPGQRYLRIDESDDSRTIKVADGVCFIATANIGNEYTSTRVMDRALLDRFVTIEMSMLKKNDEADLIQHFYPHLDAELVSNIAEIADITRGEIQTANPKISTAISTRTTIEWASLVYDGFTLLESAEVAVYPQFDNAGGVDSERTFVKQVIQKYCDDGSSENLFSLDDATLEQDSI